VEDGLLFSDIWPLSVRTGRYFTATFKKIPGLNITQQGFLSLEKYILTQFDNPNIIKEWSQEHLKLFCSKLNEGSEI